MANTTNTSSPDSYITGSPQEDDLHISTDKQFAFHGEMMMLVLVLVFTFSLLFLAYFICARQRNDASKFRQSELSPHGDDSITTPKDRTDAGPNWMPQFAGYRTTQKPAV
ncbi:hypothetical protein Tsubulata_027920 [Turnera subulata]|uniref:Uncharacterized protein n=1 Tax=Turnera subulata TaxID=218843 RepID=A0A9Q0FUC9_9ROSI|nr:hypothetical protein Tsubulata_027920 [Turnera subulata]